MAWAGQLGWKLATLSNYGFGCHLEHLEATGVTGSGNLKCWPIPPLLEPLDTPGLAVHGGVFDVTITLKAWK